MVLLTLLEVITIRIIQSPQILAIRNRPNRHVSPDKHRMHFPTGLNWHDIPNEIEFQQLRHSIDFKGQVSEIRLTSHIIQELYAARRQAAAIDAGQRSFHLEDDPS